MATNEMRAWLEEKIKHIEKFIKAYPGSIDIKKARKDMEMMQAILAALEPKMTEEEGNKMLNYLHGHILEGWKNHPMYNAIRAVILGHAPVFNEEGNSNE